MLQKRILTGLTLTLMLSLISMPVHAKLSLSSMISTFFNKPSKNALIATTAIAATSTLACLYCAWNWWKKNDEAKETKVTLKNTEALFPVWNSELNTTRNLMYLQRNKINEINKEAIENDSAHWKLLHDTRKEYKQKIEALEKEIKTLKENAQPTRQTVSPEPVMQAWDINHLNHTAH